MTWGCGIFARPTSPSGPSNFRLAEASGIPVAVIQDHGAVVSTGFPLKRQASHRCSG
jgi:hypothetical protein